MPVRVCLVLAGCQTPRREMAEPRRTGCAGQRHRRRAKAREAATPIRPSLGKLLKDRQIILFCLIYFFIQLTIYAATFWLPSIIKKMGELSDVRVGLFNSIPWLLSIVGMYAFASLSAKWKHQQAWVATALLIAAAGMFMSTTGGPIFAFVAICFAALGFKSASSLFWPIPGLIWMHASRRQ